MRWLRHRDRGLVALRRAARTAVVMPATFAVGQAVIGDQIVATFAAFGSFAMLLLVDFQGPVPMRVRAEAALAVACGVLICLGTLASQSTAVAAVAMALVAFAVLFAGVVSSVLAGATTSLLLAFILPVSLPGGIDSIPERLAGWGLAAAAVLPAVWLLWPAPARDPVRTAAIAACRAMAGRLRGEVPDPHAALAELQQVFYATPYRPTGLSTAARAVIRLVDELRWLDDLVAQAAHRHAPLDAPVRAVRAQSAEVLERGADLLERPQRSPEGLHVALAGLRADLDELERAAMSALPVPAPAAGGVAVQAGAGEAISALDPSFRAQELSFVVAQIAGNVDLAAAAERRTWHQQLLGRRPAAITGPLAAAQERAGAHVEWRSPWLQNSVRGAVALGVAVLVANLTGVQHAFWVVLGTLSVLRSNALNTGENAVRGLLGTAAGFAIGAAIVTLVGTDGTVLWVLLPPAILLAGLAPATVSFAAGQAAFTLTLLILFNIIVPDGWHVGLVRIEDVALGSAVSLAVGLLFWPRGAAGALGRALADAYVAGADYLAGAVRFGVGRCDAGTPARPAPAAEGQQAAAAARRLDDTFRSYLAERGAKPVPLPEVTSLVTGVVGLRLAGDAVVDLWRGDAGVEGDRTAARRELLGATERMTRWYEAFAASLEGRGDVPAPARQDAGADGRLVAAVDRDLRAGDGRASATAVRMIWTGDHLDAARRLEEALARPARTAVGRRALVRHAPVRP